MKIILLALRSLIRFRLYSAINIMGLALSLACVIIISRYVYSELTTDHFASNHERLFLSVRHWNNNEKVPTLLTTQNIMMRKDYKNPLDIPEIEKHTSFVSLKDVTIEVENKGFSAHVLATDSVFLQILDFPVLKGDQTKLLKDPKGAVLSESFAKKLFKNQDPIGKIINYNGQLLTIQGITGNVETKSSLSFDLLISRALQWRWPPVNYYSIALAVPHTDIDAIRNLNPRTINRTHAVSYSSFFLWINCIWRLISKKEKRHFYKGMQVAFISCPSQPYCFCLSEYSILSTSTLSSSLKGEKNSV